MIPPAGISPKQEKVNHGTKKYAGDTTRGALAMVITKFDHKCGYCHKPGHTASTCEKMDNRDRSECF